jgi:hypothetical protein
MPSFSHAGGIALTLRKSCESSTQTVKVEFGKIQAKEREKIIEDNQLYPFCLLHDKARPWGAKQRPVNLACQVPNCKCKHIRKLHELLKDVFKEESQVHLVQGDDEWEESEEAWDVDEEGEAMIVGTIQREDDCSWQDASKSWLEQDEEEEDRPCHDGMCQGTGSLPPEAREKQCNAVVHLPKEENEDAETTEDGWWTPGLEDLQTEGGEKEYFLDLLMRESALKEEATEGPSMDGGKTDQPAKKGVTRKNKAASNGGKRKGSKRTSEREDGTASKPEKKEAIARNKGRPGEGQPGIQARAAPPDPIGDPGRLRAHAQPEAKPGVQAMTTSGGECSRHE